MICPKCGHENPDNELFCEECDFRMDQKPPSNFGLDKEKKTVYIGFAAIVFGIASVLSLMLDQGLFALIFGIVGMVGGGYSINLVRYAEFPKNVRIIMFVVVAIAILSSVIGFLRGFMMVLA